MVYFSRLKQGFMLIEALTGLVILALITPLIASLFLLIISQETKLFQLLLRQSEHDIIMTRFSLQLKDGTIHKSDDNAYSFDSDANYYYRLLDQRFKLNQAPYHYISQELTTLGFEISPDERCIHFDITDIDQSTLCSIKL